MKWPRLSILDLIAGVVACGVAFAALREGSSSWLSAFYTITVALLLGAVVASRYRRGASRAFWFGFAVFGWGMFFLGTNPWRTQMDSLEDGFGGNINRNLLTTRLIGWVVARVRMRADDLDQIDSITANTVGIVHLMAVLTIAFLGGLFAVLMKRRAKRVAPAGPPLRSNLFPSLIIMAGLTFASLGTFDRPPLRETINLADRVPSRFTGEPSLKSLSQSGPEATVYRFWWSPSFHHDICVRITRSYAGAKLRVKAFTKRDFDQGHVAIDKEVELDENQWSGLERRVEAASFWGMPTEETMEGSVNDGDLCTVQGVKAGRYHSVSRQMPDPAYTALCRAILDLSGLKIHPIWDEYHPTETIP